MLRKTPISGAFVRLNSTFSTAKVLQTLSNPSLLKTDGYINGEWISTSEKLIVNNPGVDGDHVADVSSLSLEDAERAIAVAKSEFDKFKKTTPRYRSLLLSNLNKLMLENQEDLAKLIVLENGKPYADALGEIKYAASFFEWFAEEAPRVYGDVINSANPANKILTFKQPVGVCGILTPWNFPSAMITRKLGAAVAAGCTTVIKPASETPLSALALAHLAQEAGFPNGVVNMIPSKHTAEMGNLITTHPLISKVSFTGSTRVGSLLMGQLAPTLKKLSMELGGNAPFIVFDDADLDKAVDGAIASKFRSSGQTCVCANRLYVHESVYPEFTTKLTEKLAGTVRLGHGLDYGVTHGPLIHGNSLKKVRSHIDDAVAKGAQILFGGNPRSDLGANFHELTVLGNVTADMDIVHEETFGPVAPIIKFSTEEEVVAAANDTEFGLAGYFFSKDLARVFRVAQALNTGMIGVNTGAISEAALPFGGVKLSGFGREGSKYGIEDYLVTKSVVLGDVN